MTPCACDAQCWVPPVSAPPSVATHDPPSPENTCVELAADAIELERPLDAEPEPVERDEAAEADPEFELPGELADGVPDAPEIEPEPLD